MKNAAIIEPCRNDRIAAGGKKKDKKDEKKKELNGAVDKKVEKATSLVPKF
mgnify:CR=1 FL=1